MIQNGREDFFVGFSLLILWKELFLLFFYSFGFMEKTERLFDLANDQLKHIEFMHRSLPEVSVGEFWWYFEWINIWQEVSKDGNMKRPCLILKSIPHSSLIWIVPLTTKLYSWKTHQFEVSKRMDHGLKKPSALLIYQLKCIDKKRLVEKIIWKKANKWLLTLIYKKQN